MKDAGSSSAVLRLQFAYKHLAPRSSSSWVVKTMSSKCRERDKNAPFNPSEARVVLLICQEKGKVTVKRKLFFLISSLNSWPLFYFVFIIISGCQSWLPGWCQSLKCLKTKHPSLPGLSPALSEMSGKGEINWWNLSLLFLFFLFHSMNCSDLFFFPCLKMYVLLKISEN